MNVLSYIFPNELHLIQALTVYPDAYVLIAFILNGFPEFVTEINDPPNVVVHVESCK